MTAWHAHETELQRWLTRHLNDPVAAQDLLQDVFIKALRQGRRFCDVANARAWLQVAAVRGWGRLCPGSGRIRPPLGDAAIADL